MLAYLGVTAVWSVCLELLFVHVFWKYLLMLADLNEEEPTSTRNFKNNECFSLHTEFQLLNKFRSVAAKSEKQFATVQKTDCRVLFILSMFL